MAALLPPEAGGPDPERVGERRAADDRSDAGGLAGRPRGRAGRSGGLLCCPHRPHVRCMAVAAARRAADAVRPARRCADARPGQVGRRCSPTAPTPSPRRSPRSALATSPPGPTGARRHSPQPSGRRTSSCDAIVIGSGAGGAFAARALARAGLDTVIVEEGERWTAERIRASHPLDRFAQIYRDGGTTMAFGRPVDRACRWAGRSAARP